MPCWCLSQKGMVFIMKIIIKIIILPVLIFAVIGCSKLNAQGASNVFSVSGYSSFIGTIVGNKVIYINWQDGSPTDREIDLLSGTSSVFSVSGYSSFIGAVVGNKVIYINWQDGSPTGREILLNNEK